MATKSANDDAKLPMKRGTAKTGTAKRRIRKIPGVPIMYIHNHRYSIERLPEATMGGAPRI